MFGNKLRETIDQYIGYNEVMEYRKDQLETIDKFLDESQYFYFNTTFLSSLNNEGGHQLFSEEIFKDIHLPFKFCCFMFDCDKTDEVKLKIKKSKMIYKFASLVTDMDNARFMVHLMYYYTAYQRWLIHPFGFVIDANSDIPIKRFLVSKNNFDVTPEDKKFSNTIERYALSNTSNALQLLSCKNIISRTIKPSRLKQKLFRKTKMYPLLEYKVLEMELPKSKNVKYIGGESTGRSVRLHIRKGHPKTYKAPNLLFGKYEGTFWWQPHTAGNGDLGTIVKEYKHKKKKKKKRERILN